MIGNMTYHLHWWKILVVVQLNLSFQSHSNKIVKFQRWLQTNGLHCMDDDDVLFLHNQGTGITYFYTNIVCTENEIWTVLHLGVILFKCSGVICEAIKCSLFHSTWLHPSIKSLCSSFIISLILSIFRHTFYWQ